MISGGWTHVHSFKKMVKSGVATSNTIEFLIKFANCPQPEYKPHIVWIAGSIFRHPQWIHRGSFESKCNGGLDGIIAPGQVGPARRLWPDLSCELAPPAAEFAPEIVQHLGEPPICPGKAQAAPVISHLND